MIQTEKCTKTRKNKPEKLSNKQSEIAKFVSLEIDRCKHCGCGIDRHTVWIAKPQGAGA